MKQKLRIRRWLAVLLVVLGVGAAILLHPEFQQTKPVVPENTEGQLALQTLDVLEVKGRAPKTGYARMQFGDGWAEVGGCDMRNIILARDLRDEIVDEQCRVLRGTLNDPYTGSTIFFQRGETTSDDVQIDHVVALSDAWQKGAQLLTPESRQQLANDPLELLAVDGRANQQKGDSDAATWLPPRKEFRCQYVARQIAVKQKYALWITDAEKKAMRTILESCPSQTLPQY